jgi:hypothetical protein
MSESQRKKRIYEAGATSPPINISAEFLAGITEWTGSEIDFEDINKNGTQNMYRVLAALVTPTFTNIVVGMEIIINVTGGAIDFVNAKTKECQFYEPTVENEISFVGTLNSLGVAEVYTNITQKL